MGLRGQLLLQRVSSPVFGALLRLAPNTFFPVVQRPAPAGPHPAGVRDFCFPAAPSSTGRGEAARRGMARAWYPAGLARDLPRRPFFDDAEMTAIRQGAGEAAGWSAVMADQMARSVTGSREGAPLAECAAGTLPVLVFSHGFGMLAGSNTHLCEHLASHGFMVVSVAQPGSSALVTYPDGSWVGLDAQLAGVFNSAEAIAAVTAVLEARTVAERERATRDWASREAPRELTRRWVANLRRCLDFLAGGASGAGVEDLAAAGDFRGVGAFGMSFGGSASACWAQEDERVAAVANLDGGQVGTELMDKQIRVPLLQLHSTALPLASPGGFNDFHYEPHDRAGLSRQVFRGMVKSAAHMDFSDGALQEGWLARRVMGQGAVDSVRMSGLVADCCLRFFAARLREPAGSFGVNELRSLQDAWPEIDWLDGSHVRGLAAGGALGVAAAGGRS